MSFVHRMMFGMVPRVLLASPTLLCACSAAPDQNSGNEGVESTAPVSFEEFKRSLYYYDPMKSWVVERDLLLNEEQLKAYYVERYGQDQALIQNGPPGPLSATTLTYCITNSFTPSEKSALESTIAGAFSSWSAGAGVTFNVTHNAGGDASCGTWSPFICDSNSTFRVFWLAEGEEFDASAFFPGDCHRFLHIKKSVVSDLPLMRHEVGHILSFRHEQIHIGCDTEGDDAPWYPRTKYDNASVMHYDNCGGSQGSNLTLWDQRGARCAYRGECEWIPVTGQARDIGIGNNGIIWIIGNTPVSGGYNVHRWNGSAWELKPGGGVRIAVDPNGSPWMVNNVQSIYRWNGAAWVQQPGQARDIGIGPEGTVWIIGNTPVAGGFNIFKWNGSGWSPKPGGAARVAVGPGDTPWVTNSSNAIFRFNGTSWILQPGAGQDIAVSANGRVWTIGVTPYLGSFTVHNFNASTNSWVWHTGAGVALSAEPDGTPWLLSANQGIYRNRWE